MRRTPKNGGSGSGDPAFEVRIADVPMSWNRRSSGGGWFLLLNPPLPLVARAPYGVLAAAAVSLLPWWARWHLRLPLLPGAEATVVRPIGHALVHAIRWATTAPRATPAV